MTLSRSNPRARMRWGLLGAIVATAEAYAQLKEQEAGGDLKKASFNIDQDAARQLTVSRQTANDAAALVDCRARQLSDINTRLAAATNDGRITLTWDASTDNVGETQYKVYRGGVARTFRTTTRYIHIDLAHLYKTLGDDITQAQLFYAQGIVASVVGLWLLVTGHRVAWWAAALVK